MTRNIDRKRFEGLTNDDRSQIEALGLPYLGTIALATTGKPVARYGFVEGKTLTPNELTTLLGGLREIGHLPKYRYQAGDEFDPIVDENETYTDTSYLSERQMDTISQSGHSTVIGTLTIRTYPDSPERNKVFYDTEIHLPFNPKF